MLEIKLNTDKLINEDGSRILLNDMTGNYGDISYQKNDDDTYTQVSNTTGYGDPNETRESLALFLVGYKLGKEKDTYVEVDSYSPLTVSQFKAQSNLDGVYKFYLISVPHILSPQVESYVEGDVVYDTLTSSIFKVSQGVFEVVKPESLINTVYSTTSYMFPHLVKSGKLYTELVNKRVDLMIRCCAEKDITACTKAIDDIRTGIYSMNYEFCKGNYINASIISDYLNNKDYSNVLSL
jgi:hypothetical protein